MAQWFCHILKIIWWMNVVLGILNQYGTLLIFLLWPKNIYVGQLPTFHGSDFALYLEYYLMYKPQFFGYVVQCYTKFGLIRSIWVTDLYFMIQRFWLVYLFLWPVEVWYECYKLFNSKCEVGASMYFGHIASFSSVRCSLWLWHSIDF